jgi:CTP synthase
MEDQQHVTDMGGTMRLGAYPYRRPGHSGGDMAPQVSERHRIATGVNNKYRDQFIEHG